MPVPHRYFKMIFPNGVVKYYKDVSRTDFGELMESDENNLCANGCGRPAIYANELLTHTGRYDNWSEEIGDTIYKVFNLKDKWCRGCQIHDSSVANLMYGQQFIDYNKRYHKCFDTSTESGYYNMCRMTRGQSLSSYADDIDTYFYYADIKEDTEVYKIGICFNLDSRLHKSYSKLYHDKYTLINIHPIVHKNSVLITELEYHAKLKFGIRGYALGHEFIKKSDLSNLIEFSEQFKLE